MCISARVYAQKYVHWSVSYHATFASSEAQKYTPASWDKQEQIRLCGSPSSTPMGCLAFVYQPSWRCEIFFKGYLNLTSAHTSKSGKRGEKSGYQSCVNWINRRSTWPLNFSIPLFNWTDTQEFDIHCEDRVIRLLSFSFCDLKARLQAYCEFKWQMIIKYQTFNATSFQSILCWHIKQLKSAGIFYFKIVIVLLYTDRDTSMFNIISEVIGQ